MFRVKKKDIRTTPVTSFWFHTLFWCFPSAIFEVIVTFFVAILFNQDIEEYGEAFSDNVKWQSDVKLVIYCKWRFCYSFVFFEDIFMVKLQQSTIN